MMDEKQLFILTEEQRQEISVLLEYGRRDVSPFYNEGECEIIYYPVTDGELKVFHHNPEKKETKRPIVFLPGYISAPPSWVDFTRTHHEICEYYYLESREKASSKLKRHRRLKFTIEESARDLQKAIKHLDLENKDYVLFATSYGGAIVLQAISENLINPSTVILFDPAVKWIYSKAFTNFINFITPPFILGVLRIIIARLYLLKMKNEAQKKRYMLKVKSVQAWKFRKCTHQNRKYDISTKLPHIKKDISIFHGPLDKYHPREEFYNYAKTLPKGRFFFMETDKNDRELLAGVIATEFAKITKDEDIPQKLLQFEIK
ncbi:MAG: alpha/beta hydrolase [Asgard group archaeon]|nr:alpha/beta hydrolase [Asgard group archaeon]